MCFQCCVTRVAQAFLSIPRPTHPGYWLAAFSLAHLRLHRDCEQYVVAASVDSVSV